MRLGERMERGTEELAGAANASTGKSFRARLIMEAFKVPAACFDRCQTCDCRSGSLENYSIREEALGTQRIQQTSCQRADEVVPGRGTWLTMSAFGR